MIDIIISRRRIHIPHPIFSLVFVFSLMMVIFYIVNIFIATYQGNYAMASELVYGGTYYSILLVVIYFIKVLGGIKIFREYVVSKKTYFLKKGG